jgi:hypothetical protein
MFKRHSSAVYSSAAGPKCVKAGGKGDDNEAFHPGMPLPAVFGTIKSGKDSKRSKCSRVAGFGSFIVRSPAAKQ